MRVEEYGFTLLETLIAIALSSMVLIGAARLLPALHAGVLRQYQQVALEEALWQLAFSLGKIAQRAGYCNGICSGEGLILNSRKDCAIVRWDANNNGRWEPSGHAESEQTGYRLRDGTLQTLRGATSCEGKGWEKVSDPAQVTLSLFSVTLQPRTAAPPLIIITLTGKTAHSYKPLVLRHVVVGNNL